MNFTFGIITIEGNEGRVDTMIDSIHTAMGRYDLYEIIVVGGKGVKGVNHIDFNENAKLSWITKKKNMITQNAKYENIVYLHDYIALDSNWYSGFQHFGNDWDVCMSPMVNTDGTRYRDWCLNPWKVKDSALQLPYNVPSLNEIMYISGAYWVAKKSVMEQYPLNDTLSWGESEDIEWSMRCLPNVVYKLNLDSKVHLLKKKSVKFAELCSVTRQK